MIKILEKLLLYQVTYHLPDTQPVYIAFNVEIFNGLFTASCMRNTISTMVTVVLMIVDFLSCTAALYGLQNRFIRVDEMNIKVGPEFTRATMIEVALLILSDESCSAFTTDVMEPLKIKRFSATIVPLSLLSSVESWGYRKPVSGRRTFKNIVLETVPPVAAPPPRLKKKVSTNSAVERPKSAVSWSQSRGHFLENKLHASTILKALSVDERQRFVLETCRVLRRVESLLIVEYIEVMVPVLYGTPVLRCYDLRNTTAPIIDIADIATVAPFPA
ncbi:hypothetical protein ON010_g1261 [Phytophthora cinnamomi]|nr:hypothetical protein ON010_g1261 [Phytophthora cinnamomi]